MTGGWWQRWCQWRARRFVQQYRMAADALPDTADNLYAPLFDPEELDPYDDEDGRPGLVETGDEWEGEGDDRDE